MSFQRSPISLATKIFMLYKDRVNRTFLILEGPTDYNLWIDNFSYEINDLVKIEFSGSKDVSLETLKILYEDFSKETQIKGVIAIVDADFDHLKKKKIFSSPYLFRTDYHDIEIMMLTSKAFVKFFNRYCTETERLKHCLKQHFKREIADNEITKCFLKALLDNTKKIGILRWINYLNDFQLSFKDLNYYYIMDDNLFSLNRDKLIKHIITKNHKNKEYKIKIEESFRNELNKELDNYQICQGHDAISILTIWINYIFCKREAFSFLQSKDIHIFFESAFEFRFFTEFKLYKNLKLWEENNFPFKIFK